MIKPGTEVGYYDYGKPRLDVVDRLTRGGEICFLRSRAGKWVHTMSLTVIEPEATQTDLLIAMNAFVEAGPNNHVNSQQMRAALDAVFAARAESLRKRFSND